MNVELFWRKGLPVVVLLMSALPLGAQAAFAYDTASVKPNLAGSSSTHESIHTDRYLGTNLTVAMMLETAYGLTAAEQISGLPGWAGSAHFDVQAKVDAETLARLKTLDAQDNQAARQQMLQGILADRFALKVHRETKEMAVFVLEAAKGGVKFKPADPNDKYANGMKNAKGEPRGAGSMSTGNGTLTAQGEPVASLAGYLSSLLHRKVEDRTGLVGNYDFQMKWSRDEDAATAEAPGLFTALQEQLGLKLDSSRGMVETIVVDRVEQPVAD